MGFGFSLHKRGQGGKAPTKSYQASGSAAGADPLAWVPVRSSNLRAVQYMEASSDLYIWFHYNDAVYRYENVPPTVYGQLIQQSSVGDYFQTTIKPMFPSTKM